MVLLPACLTGIGAAAGGAVMVADALIARALGLEAGSVLDVRALQLAGYVAGMVLVTLLIGLLLQEAIAAHRERRVQSAAVGWTTLVVAVLFLAALSTAVFRHQGPLAWIALHACNLVVALAATAASVALYARRIDFTG